MKIYIENLHLDELKNLDKLIKKTIEYQFIYSENGIYKIENNKIIQLIPNDISLEKYNNDNLNFIIDYSYYNYNKNIYHIPFNHIIDNIEENNYKLNNLSKISLIIEYNVTESKDYNKKKIYFSTNEKKFDKNLKNNIIEYISLLKDNKQY